jgi:hypothetical protein
MKQRKALKESKKPSAAEIYRKYKTIFKALEKKHGLVGIERKVKSIERKAKSKRLLKSKR